MANPELAWGVDGGTKWDVVVSAPPEVHARRPGDGAHVRGEVRRVGRVRYHAHGCIHRNVRRRRREQLRYATGERAAFHVVVDADGNALHAQRLPTLVEEDPRVPPSVGPPLGRDDDYQPAFWSDGGAVAWTRDKGVDLTHVVVGASGD